jgi:3'-phosphoadenosine 5'-phosphosulfate sulfotransferase (PAPS reductase)/FAD synthetase
MIGNHENVVLQYSGGMDSLALLYLARPYLDRITVLYGDPGATFPHVLEHIHRTCEALGARLQIVRPEMPVQQWHEVNGLPSDIVPLWTTAEMASVGARPRQLLQSTMSCCWKMLWLPMMAAIYDSGATLVLRGAKAADERRGVASGWVDERGIQYDSPLWEWSEDGIRAYLAAEGAELPKQYAYVKDSLDCSVCTGHMAHYAGARLRYIRDHHKDIWPELADRIRRVRAAVSDEQNRIDGVLSVVEELP